MATVCAWSKFAKLMHSFNGSMVCVIFKLERVSKLALNG